MVAISANYSAGSYLSLVSSNANPASTRQAIATETGTAGDPATSVTLSEAARATLAGKDLPTVTSDARTKLDALLKEAGRTSPLEGEALALDLSSLDPRELYAMASQDAFSKDEHTAAGLEMQRRFEAALSGPAAVAKVTGNLTGLYKAAAAFLDSLGLEEKAGADWIAGRAAVDEGLKQLQANPKTMPNAGDDDPVALYLALVEAGDTSKPPAIADVATSARKVLDKLYADAIRNGKAPTFNKQTTIGAYIDMSQFDSRSLSAIALNTGTKFATEEVNAANQALRGKSGAALMAGWQSASKSGDPTAFSQNIISLYSAMSPEERQAAGWSEQFYTAAVESYQSTSKLTQMFAEAGGSSTGFLSWMGK
jgi:hypothetical protein